MLHLLLILLAYLAVVTTVAGIGNTFSEANLNLDLGSGAPATWYVAMLTALPTDGTGASAVEATYTGYLRQAVTNSLANFPAASAVGGFATITCQATITFPSFAGLGGPITIVGVVLVNHASNAISSTNMGRVAQPNSWTSPTPLVFNNGSQLVIPAGNLSFQIL